MRGGSGGRWTWVVPPLLIASAVLLLALGGSRELPGTAAGAWDSPEYDTSTLLPYGSPSSASGGDAGRSRGRHDTAVHPSDSRAEARALPVLLQDGDACRRALAALGRCLGRHPSLTGVALTDSTQRGGAAYRVRWEYDPRDQHLAYRESGSEATAVSSWCCEVSRDVLLALGNPTTGAWADLPALDWRMCSHRADRAPWGTARLLGRETRRAHRRNPSADPSG